MVDDIAAGLYRIPIGPGAINNKALKPKSVTAGTISVSDLESVNAKTGNLTANGTITVNSTGSIAIGKTSYADDSTGGMWVGYSGGTYKLNLGNSTYSVKWDGSALNITGNITATTGTIGGWTIGATDLTSDAGATGMASSGGHRLWVGNATPGSAPFRVTNAGVLWASGATITGGITASSLTITGTATFSGGSMTLPNGGSITSSAMDLNQGTLANLTVDGDITVGTGGKIKFGSGAADYINNNIIHFEVTGTETTKVEWKNGSNTPYGYLSGRADSTTGQANVGSYYNTTHVSWLHTESRSNYAQVGLYSQAGNLGQYQSYIFVEADDTLANNGITFAVATNNVLSLKEANSSASFYGYIYPGTGSYSQSSRYIYDASSNINVVTDTLYISGNASAAGLRFAAIANGGSASNWSGFASANIPSTSAGYFKVNIGGTNYRVPFYADA